MANSKLDLIDCSHPAAQRGNLILFTPNQLLCCESQITEHGNTMEVILLFEQHDVAYVLLSTQSGMI